MSPFTKSSDVPLCSMWGGFHLDSPCLCASWKWGGVLNIVKSLHISTGWKCSHLRLQDFPPTQQPRIQFSFCCKGHSIILAAPMCVSVPLCVSPCAPVKLCTAPFSLFFYWSPAWRPSVTQRLCAYVWEGEILVISLRAPIWASTWAPD